MNILDQCVSIHKTKKSKSTHFALCNGDKLRYLIDINNGKNELVKNISTYSSKMKILMIFLKLFPLSILQFAKLGYFAKVQVDDVIENVFIKNNITNWNMIIGTYDEKQKLVFQCYKKSELSKFIKVGNVNTQKEMLAEIQYLKEHYSFNSFEISKIIYSETIKENNRFNIQITNEFKGNKIELAITDDIYRIYRELSNKVETINNVTMACSHGDFTPWNIKKDADKYIVFDWEHTKKRFLGYDLIHYTYMIERLFNNRTPKEAVNIAVEKAKNLDERLQDKDSTVLCDMYLENVKLTLGHE